MKAIVKKSTDQVFFLFEDSVDVTLDENGLFSPDIRSNQLTTVDYDLVEGVSAPAEWVAAGALSYDGAWAVYDQSRFDAVIAARAEHDAQMAELSDVKILPKSKLYLGLKAQGLWPLVKAHLASDEDDNDHFQAADTFRIEAPQVTNMVALLNAMPEVAEPIDLQEFFNFCATQ